MSGIGSTQFIGDNPAECYKKYYSWSSDLVRVTKKKLNVVDKFLLVEQYQIESKNPLTLHPIQYALVVIYFKE